MGFRFTLLTALIVVLAGGASATTYYISQNGSGGDGRSWATAWTTIDDVNTGVSSGDTVFFGTGTWIGTQLRCVAGSYSDRTVYACSSFADTNYEGEYHFAKIWGATSLANAYQNVIQCHYDNSSRLSYVTLYGLELAYGRPRVISIYGVTVDSFFVEHCKLVGCISSEYNNPSLWHSGTMVGSEGSFNRLVACSLSTAYGPGGGHGAGIGMYSQNDMTIDSCVFYGHFDGACVWWKNDNDGKNYRNIVKNSIFTPTSADYGGAIWLYRNQNDDSIYNNIFAGGLSSGVRVGNHTSRPNYNTVILNNTFIDVAGHGGDRNCIDGYATTGTVFKYNVEVRTTTPFQVMGECLDGSDFDIDSNIYVVGSAQAEYGYRNYVSQSYWINTLGQDRNSAFWSSVSNIGFADYTNGDYTRSPDTVEMDVYFDNRVWNYYGANLLPAEYCPRPLPPVLAGPSDGGLDLSQPISLVWNSSVGADEYHVQVDNDPSFASREFEDQTTGLTASVSGLLDGVTYYWRVRGADTCGWGGWSTVWTFTISGGTGGGTANYALGVVPQVDGTYSGYSPLAITDGVNNPYGGTSTTWASQESSSTPHWIVTDFGTTRQVNQVVVKWAWNANRSSWMTSQQYHIQRWNGTDYEDVVVVTSPAVDSVTVTSFPEVSTSRMRILQPANMGPSNYPTVIWLTELEERGTTGGEEDNIAPSPIDDLGAVPGSSHGEIQLVWTATGDDGMTGTLSRYEVMWSLEQITGSYWSAKAVLHSPASPGSEESLTIVGLKEGYTYYVAVMGFDESGNSSGLSNVAVSFANGIRPPPWLFTRVDEFGQSAELSCSTVVSYQNVDSYRFVLVDSASSDSSFQSTVDITNSTASVTFGSLDENSLYYWMARAVSSGTDTSLWSPPKKFRLSNVCPDPPQVSYPADEDTIFASSDDFAIVVFNGTDDDSTGQLTYDFELYGDDSSPLASASDVMEGTSTTSWTVPVSLQGNKTYSWRARSFDGIDYSFWTEWSQFLLVGTTSSLADSGPRIIAFPNPVYFTQGQYVTFRLPDEPVDLLIQTVSGETVLLKTGLSGDWHWYGQNASGTKVAVGIYTWFVRGTDQNGKIVVKP